MTRDFANFAVVDWSGQAVARPKGLAVAHASKGRSAPTLLRPSGGWSRPAVLEWLERLANSKADILIGLDLSPALPFADTGDYFPNWPQSPPNARRLWEMVDRLAYDDEHLAASSFIAGDEVGRHFRQLNNCGDRFGSGRGRLRVCERGQAAMGLSPQSCFNLVGAAQVGKSSLTGMRVLHRLQGRIPVWPFDPLPTEGPAIVEIYTAIASRAAGIRKGLSKVRDAASLDAVLNALGSYAHRTLDRYDDHSTDAILTTAWLRNASIDTRLWNPQGLTPALAQTEGWTFGVV
ncbi:MAG: hypothetical protein ABIS39_04075 [Sphingomicrobium sp.]